MSESWSCVNSRWSGEGTLVGVAELFELELAEWFQLEKSRQFTKLKQCAPRCSDESDLPGHAELSRSCCCAAKGKPGHVEQGRS